MSVWIAVTVAAAMVTRGAMARATTMMIIVVIEAVIAMKREPLLLS